MRRSAIIKPLFALVLVASIAQGNGMAATTSNQDRLKHFQDSWLSSALKLQREIDIDVPLKEATFIGTHNSYNSKAYQNSTGRYIDPNHLLTVREQLELGIRSIEYDLHWSLSDNFKKQILLCHGRKLVGCSIFDRKVEEGLIELRDWLKANPKEIVLLYVENYLDGHEQRMTDLLKEYLEPFIYKPNMLKQPKTPVNTCHSLPGDLTKAHILEEGKQLLIVTKGCYLHNKIAQNATDNTFADYVFSGIGDIPYYEDTFIDDKVDDFHLNDCGKSVFSADKEHNSIWRIFEDRTFISNMGHKLKQITSDDVRDLERCGINWPTFDMLEMNDERLFAAVWSWAPLYPQPGLGNCSIYKKDEGIINQECNAYAAGYACKNTSTQTFKAISLYGQWNSGETLCQFSGKEWHFAVPVNGGEMEQLRISMKNLLLPHVWLNYAYREGKWVPNK